MLMNRTALLADFIRKTSTELPEDVVEALQKGGACEDAGSRAAFVLDTVLENVDLARERVVPLCQDTGTLTFWVDVPRGFDTVSLGQAIREAVAEATRQGWLRQNTISEPDGRSLADNLSESHPVLHFHASDREDVSVRLLMKGGGCENMSRQYSLPDSFLEAGRDLEGVRRCILDCAWQAQGKGCAPGILGVCIGGDRATGYEVAKAQLLRSLTEEPSPDPALAALETRVFEEAQTLGIGPMGMAGKTTLLGVRIGAASRLPASYFVTVAYMCWACRRGTLLLPGTEAV